MSDSELDRLLAECDEIFGEVDGTDREVFARLKTRDGRPIVMGGTYYGASDNCAWKVVGYGREHVWCDGLSGVGKRIRPEWLMARPDSWERVSADACKGVATYCEERPWVRGAGCTDSGRAVQADLVARCKALAGVR